MRSASGSGMISTDRNQLAFVYEQNLKVLPTFAVVLGLSPYLLRDADAGIDFAQLVHGEESVTFHRRLLPPAGWSRVRASLMWSTRAPAGAR